MSWEIPGLHWPTPILAVIVLSGPCVFATQIQRSRFLAKAQPLANPAAAEAAIAALRCADASHNCWAWRVGSYYRSDDDGEPAGTAGRPILAAIDAAGLDQTLVLVARWFGGIKLGTGGLVRAYGGTAAECLRLAPKHEVRPRRKLRFRSEYAQLGLIHRLLCRFDARLVEECHQPTGVHWTVELDALSAPAFVQALKDGTRGRIEVIEDAR